MSQISSFAPNKRKSPLLIIALFLFATVTSFFFQNCVPQQDFDTAEFSSEENHQPARIDSADLNAIQYIRGSEIPKMFGFFADAMQGVGNGNYLRSTHQHANVHFISGENPAIISEKVKIVKSLNSNAILMLQNQIFEWKTVRLHKQAQDMLQAVKSKLQADQTLESVVAIYVIDEPYWTNQLNTKPLSPVEVHQSLQKAAELIHNIFGSDILLMSSEAYPILSEHQTRKNWPGFPQIYDLLAVNCYLAFGNICDTDEKYVNLINILESTLHSNQKLFLTLDNYWNTSEGQQLSIQQRLIQRTNLQVEIARMKGIKVLVSFLYQSMPAAIDNLIGLDQMPQVLAHVQNVSDTHLNRTTQSQPQPQPQPPPPAPPSTPPPPTGSIACNPQATPLLCSVNGVEKNISVQILSSGQRGDTTSSYKLPAGYNPVKMSVQWTCNGKNWIFSHPNGWCALQTPPLNPAPAPQPEPMGCKPTQTILLCSVNGVQQNITAQILSSGQKGERSNSYSLPAGYIPEKVNVQWTCDGKNWIFSHPDGWCALRR